MKKEYIVAQCIDDVLEGRSSVDDCVRRYPGIKDLRPLLETALKIEPEKTGLSGESKLRIRSAVLSAVKEFQGRRQARGTASYRPVLAFRTAATIGAVLAWVAVAGGGAVYASQRSVPGDPLYPIKTGSENVRLALTFSAEAKADFRLKLAQTRVDEMATQASRGEDTDRLEASVASELDKAVSSMASSKDAEIKEFSQRLAESTLHSQLSLDAVVKSATPNNEKSLQQTLAVLRRGKVIGDVSFDNPSFLGTRPSVLDSSLENGEFKISGKVTDVAGNTWQIDGMTLNNVHYPGNTPPVDGQVLTEGISHAGQTYVVKVEPESNAAAGASIQGTFEGTAQDGTVWYVGGVPVTVPQNVTPPTAGDELHLKQPPQSAADKAPQVESRKKDNIGVEYTGKLSGVDANAKTITVKKAGTRITANISSARITTEDNRTLTLAQLQSSVGRYIDAKGLYRKNGTLYATEVRVEN